jgi:hypothetical protein
MKYKLPIGVVVGIILSFFSVSLFDQWKTFSDALVFAPYNIIETFAWLIGANFEFDIISYFAFGPYTIQNFFQPALLGCIFIGFTSGIIARGLKRSILASLLVIIISLLIWIILYIFSGQDLGALFQGTLLIPTVGGMIGALAGGLLGGLLAGLATISYEEGFY